MYCTNQPQLIDRVPDFKKKKKKAKTTSEKSILNSVKIFVMAIRLIISTLGVQGGYQDSEYVSNVNRTNIAQTAEDNENGQKQN